ncbi:hypothetical protein BG011_006818 [Mortierella polycephala]|uniref:Uncharacterized protein n=1 Tax=Mortierella polycephala TaxID=41804 RepID=A0A9P6PTV8_9FUNG|nr:hypothetical protein BG011_006818 [Mortierella polycephala]
MTAVIASVYPKVRSWVASITSPSSTHASGMLIILGILAAVTEAQSVKEPIRVHHPKVSARPSDHADPSASSPSKEHEHQSSPEALPLNNQEMLYYVAMGMLVSQGLIRFVTYISNRRTAAAAQAAHKKNDDLAGDDDGDDENTNTNNKARKARGGLSINAFEDLDEEAIQKRKEHLAALNDNASLLGSDSEDEDYEQSEGEETSSDEEDLDEDEDDVLLEEPGVEGELERRRNVPAAGDAKN